MFIELAVVSGSKIIVNTEYIVKIAPGHIEGYFIITMGDETNITIYEDELIRLKLELSRSHVLM